MIKFLKKLRDWAFIFISLSAILFALVYLPWLVAILLIFAFIGLLQTPAFRFWFCDFLEMLWEFVKVILVIVVTLFLLACFIGLLVMFPLAMIALFLSLILIKNL